MLTKRQQVLENILLSLVSVGLVCCWVLVNSVRKDMRRRMAATRGSGNIQELEMVDIDKISGE